MPRQRARRLVLVVPWFPNISETFAVARVLGLLDRGWDVHVLCDGSPERDRAAFPELMSRPDIDARIHRTVHARTYASILLRLPITLVYALINAPLVTLRYLFGAWRRYGVRAARRFVEDGPLIALSPHVLHFEFGHLAVGHEDLGDLLGCAVVASFQGYDLNYVGLEADPGYYAPLWERADAIHFVSEDMQRRGRKRGLPQDAPAFVVPNGVNPAFAVSTRSHVAAGHQDRPLRIVSVGRLHWKKGYEFALMAVRSLIDSGVACDYRVIGDGEAREAVLFARSDLGLTDAVTLIGALPHGDVREHLEWADVFLHAATSEGFCIAVAEAQSMGLPVVTSDADGLADNVIDGETGFVVARRDAVALAGRLAELASDPSLRERMGTAAQRHVTESFSMDRYLNGMENVFIAACGR